MEVETKCKPKNRTWSDEIAQQLLDTGIQIKNVQDERHMKTANKTTLNYAVECIKEKEKDEQIMAPINHARMHEETILPCELLGLTGQNETKGFKNELERSCLLWKMPFPAMPKLSKNPSSTEKILVTG